MKRPARIKDGITEKQSVKTSPDLYYMQHPYLLQAHQLNNEKKYDSAIALYKKAAEKFLSDKQWLNFVWVNGYIARLYLNVAGKDFNDALPYLKNSLDSGITHLKPNTVYLAPTYNYYGLYYARMNKKEDALKMFRQSLSILSRNSLDSSIYAADNYEAIADVYFNESYKNLEAEEYYLKAINLKEMQAAPVRDSDIAISYYNLVSLYDYIGEYDKSQYYCQKAIQMVPFIRNHRDYWLELLNGVAGHLYSKQQRNDKAIATLKDVIKMNRKGHHDKVLLAFYLSSLGDIYAEMCEYDSAINHYHQSLNTANNTSVYEDLELQRASTSYDLGMALLKTNKFRQAIEPLQYNLRFRLQRQPGNTKENRHSLHGHRSVF